MRRNLPVLFMMLLMALPLACSKETSNPVSADASGVEAMRIIRRTKTPTPTRTNTPTVQQTPPVTNTFTCTPTSTFTQEAPPPATPTWTATPRLATPTPTATGCAKVSLVNMGLPSTSVTAPTTFTALNIRTGHYSAYCLKYVTGLVYGFTVSGNLASQIASVQLYRGSTLVGTKPYASTVSFTGAPLGTVGDQFILKVAVPDGATGTLQARLASFTGYQDGYGSGTAVAVYPYPTGSTITVNP